MRIIKKLRLIICIILIYLALIISNPFTMATSKPIIENKVNFEDANVKDTTISVKATDYNYIQRNFQFSGEGHFFIRRINFNTNNGYYESSYLIPGNNGSVTFFKDKKMHTTSLEDGFLPLDSILYLETDKHSMIISQAYSYKDLDYGTKDTSSDTYPVSITKENDYFRVKYRFKNLDDYHGILWGLASDNQLIDLNNNDQKNIWSNYDLTNMARLCEDGYYYKSPSSYTPSTPTSYWRNPSMYIVQSWVNTGGSLAANILAKSYLFIGIDNINEEGFFPTLPQSDWLKEDYGIGAGFFDTRFNADMGETYLNAYKKFKYPQFKEAYEKLASYYTRHIMANHYSIYDNVGNEGWLVEDYGYDEDIKPVHVSLNHQIFAADWYLQIFEFTNDKEFEKIALKMLQGVKNTRDGWIKNDNNLEYAYFPDGSYGLVEYPFLTYNDLFDFQNSYSRIYGFRDKDIDILMNAKKIWMDTNGVTEYRK